MVNYFEEGILTTPKIVKLSGVDKSTVSRFVNQKGIISQDGVHRQGIKISYDIPTSRKILSNFIASKKLPRGDRKVISFYNFKGGTGKTTISYQFATHLSLCGYNVLVIDSDPQGHLSSSLGFDTNEQYQTLFDIVVNKIPATNVIHNISEGLDCIPANLSLTKLEAKINEMTRREERFSLDLKLKEKYDFIIFDTNPTISMVNRNIAIFSDVIYIVTETQPYSLHGLKMLMADLEEFFFSMEKEMPSIKIIPNKYEERTTSSAEAIASLYKIYDGKVFKDFAIRRLEEFVKSSKIGSPLAFFCKSKSQAYEDIVELIHITLNDLTYTLEESPARKRASNG